jgi:pSer/pThr/pTyr-binding forkhead associated (FHA) protein
LLPALLFGQAKVHLEFESGGPRIGWVASQPSAAPDSAAKWDTKSYDLDTSSATSGGTMYVLDTASGNLAEKKLSDAGKGWLVKDADFKTIGEVKVSVEHDRKAVQVADVVLNDGSHSQNGLIDASSNGATEFYDLKPGNLAVGVNYHSGSNNKSQKQSFEVDLKRDNAVPVLVVAISGDVATVSSASADTPSTSGTATPGSSASPGAGAPAIPKTKAQSLVGSIAVYIFGILFAAAIVWFGYMWLQGNHDKAQGALQRVGLSIHDPSPFDPITSNAVNTATTPAPQPQQQILLSDAAPTPLAPIHQPQPAFGATSVASSPQLKRDTGEVFQLPEGSSTLGRDASVGLSFPAETSLSRRHAEVVRTGNQVVVRDLGSTNGTFVNGNKVAADTPLHPGDSVQFGMIRFRYEG